MSNASPSASLPRDHAQRMARARLSLEGLSIGDAFGERFFAVHAHERIRQRALPGGTWHWTDDTAMAVSIFEVLDRLGRVDPDALAEAFAERYAREPGRGYGGMAHRILHAIGAGEPWEIIATQAFGGEGSMGNGGGMRSGPVGGYFADDLAKVVENARHSARVTHAHPEGQAGAIAIAVAAAAATEADQHHGEDGRWLIQVVFDHTPEGPTRRGLSQALDLPLDESVYEAVERLGNGSQVIAPDTIPFAVWCAARHLSDFEEALWFTVSGLGDRDTTCAMVGSIVALAVGEQGIPDHFRRAREALPV